MPIEMTCPHCGKPTMFADNYAGMSGPCPHCGQPVTVPVEPTTSGGPVRPASGTSTTLLTVLGLIAGCFVLLSCGGVLLGLLLPAVQASREAARRMSCSNNLKQIGLALYNYESVHGTLPPAYMTDSDGNPTVSWRVLILPFLEQQALYNQIDTQQPWNSPANAALLDVPLLPFSCPSSVDATSTDTNYMVVTGPETLFPNEQGFRLTEATDGLGTTIAVVEVEGQGVHWAAPQDLDYQTLELTFRPDESGHMGSRHPGGIQVLFADGSVRFLAESIDPVVLNAMLTPAGDEPTPQEW